MLLKDRRLKWKRSFGLKSLLLYRKWNMRGIIIDGVRIGLVGTQKWFCWEVARMNKLEYLVWLREVKNCAWSEGTIKEAARLGNLAMVKYCVDNGCPMDAWACEFAAEKGHLDVLKYLHENDCPWISLACSWAHEYNRIDCLNYLIEQKCPGFERYLPPAPASQ